LFPLTAHAQIAYELRPHMTGGALSAVEVTVRLRGSPDGRTVLELPDDFAGEKERWRRLDSFQSVGARIEEDGPARRILRSAPGAAITLRYRVTTAYEADPSAGEEIYKGPAIRPTWFYAIGEFVFVKPAGRGDERATFRWVGWPHTWMRGSDGDHWRFGRAMTVDDVLESTLLSGKEARFLTRPITGGTLRFIMLGNWAFGASRYADLQARVLSAQRSFWGDVAGPHTATLIQLPLVQGRSAYGGTGRSDGFGTWATPNILEEELIFLVAHEHLHTWIPRRLGVRPQPNEIAGYWLSEGFTDFYTQRTLIRARLWTPEKFVADLNRILTDYALSPVRSDPNTRIVADFWTDRRLTYLPYRRGALFAYVVDHELRRASGGRANLDTVMFAMRDRWAASPATAKPALVESFVEAATRSGFDPRAWMASMIEAGEPVLLPPDLFQGCATVSTERIAAYDPGFDRAQSSRTGIVTGVHAAGPAYAAGLRDGMKLVGRVGGLEGDSRVRVGYRILENGGERVIRFLPEGKGRLTLQRVNMLPLDAAQNSACAAKMGGAIADQGLSAVRG
jgi:predicted metalloprotease with PDZ domain